MSVVCKLNQSLASEKREKSVQKILESFGVKRKIHIFALRNTSESSSAGRA
jgi:hypothetical protein